LGVAALIVSLSLVNGFEDEIRGMMIGTNAHITVYSYERARMRDWRRVRERVLEQDGAIEGVAPFVYAKSVISSRRDNDGIMVRGILPDYEKTVSNVLDKVVSGRFFSETDSFAGIPPVVLGSILASELGVIPGDTVIMYTLSGREGSMSGVTPRPKRFRVCGVFETGLIDFDGALAYIPMDIAQDFFELGDAVTGLHIRIRDFYHADRIAGEIEDRMGFPYYAISWAEMNKALYSWMTLEKWGLTLVLMLIIAVAAFNIASTLIMVVLERTTEIGILKAIGVTRRQIVRIFLLQGAFVGILGTLLGAGFGLAVCWVQNRFGIISLPAEVYSISKLPMDVRALDVTIIVAVSLVISVFSAIYPAIRASKLDPIETIRYG